MTAATNTYVSPTSRAIWLMAVGILPALGLALLQPQWWGAAILWAAGVFGLVALDGFLSASARGVSVAADIPPVFYVGNRDPLEFTLTFAAGSAPPTLEAELDVGELFDIRPPIRLGRLSDAEWGLIAGVRADRRGEFSKGVTIGHMRGSPRTTIAQYIRF